MDYERSFLICIGSSTKTIEKLIKLLNPRRIVLSIQVLKLLQLSQAAAKLLPLLQKLKVCVWFGIIFLQKMKDYHKNRLL